jgi:hypothetical protein
VIIIVLILIVGFGVFLNDTYNTTTNTTGITSTGSVSSSSYATNSTSTAATSPCNEGVYNTKTELNMENVPVLLMQPTTTAYICVTYQSAWQGNSSQYEALHFSNYTFQFSLSVSKEHCVTSDGGTSCTGNVSNSFEISASPNSIQPSPETNYVSVVYTVTALGNSTGFYDHSAPYNYCSGMPMAVGYPASEVNASDFSPIVVIPCPLLVFHAIGVSVGGMNVTYIPFGSQA